jgi:NitT/TauT family transport system substrate-binding protein
MILRFLAALSLIASLLSPASAQERVTVGTMRLIANGALFLAAAQGYFKAEGLELEMTAYTSDQEVVEALAVGATDFGLAGFTATAFNLAGKGTIKAIAAQVREKRGYEGNAIVVSNDAYGRGLRKPEYLAKASAAVGQPGSSLNYQLAQIARLKRFDPASITLKPQGSLDAIAGEVAMGTVDAAILPGPYARELLVANKAKLVGWYSELDEQQLGALFVSAKTIETRRALVEKFMRAYRRGAADYATALMRHDSSGKRVSNAKSLEVSTTIARYVYPGRSKDIAAVRVEAGAYFMDPQARLDAADVARQVEWYQSQGVVEPSVNPRSVVDLSFVAGR